MLNKMVLIIGAMVLVGCGKDSSRDRQDDQDTVLIDIELDPATTKIPQHNQYPYQDNNREDTRCNPYQNGSHPCMPRNAKKPSNQDACQWNGYTKAYSCRTGVTSCLIRSTHQRDTLYPNGIRVTVENMKRCIANIGY